MKKIFLMAALAIGSLTAKAQSNADEIGLIQSAYGMEKKQIVIQCMKLTDAEAAGFWKVYDEYELERKDLGKKRIDNIMSYANNAAGMTDAKATELAKASLDLHISFAKLQEKAMAKAAKVMSPLRAVQWIQLEVYLEHAVRMEIYDDIPMIGELEKAQKK